MERRIVNPWTWQDQFGFVQANETSGVERVLLCSGQTSVAADGQPTHEGTWVRRSCRRLTTSKPC